MRSPHLVARVVSATHAVMVARRRRTLAVVLGIGAILTTACGGDDSPSDADAAARTSTSVAEVASSTSEPTPMSSTSAPATTITPSSTTTTTTTSDPAPTTSAEPDDQGWRDRADEICAHYLAVFAIPEPGGDASSLEAFVAAHREVHDAAPDIGAVELPPGPGRGREELLDAGAGIGAALDRAAAAAATGDVAGTWDGIETMDAHLGFLASAFAAAGQSCGPADTERAGQAALNVSIVSPWQVAVGFESVWVSQFRSDTVVRIDPADGRVLAMIEVPSQPVKLQPAAGVVVVRTAESYEVIDVATDTITSSLRKSDVGPEANRSWAVDGALWICDGRQLHRYDPSTLTPLARLDLDLECGQVYATDELAIAWTYNEEPGESGDSRAAFIDPATNTVLTTVDLPADAGVPFVLDDVVFFPPQLGNLATVVDRSTLTLATPFDLGRFIDGGSQGAFDGESVYLIADKPTGTVVVIDPSSFEVTGEVMAMHTAPSLNALAASPGVLWAVNNSGGILQRFDTSG